MKGSNVKKGAKPARVSAIPGALRRKDVTLSDGGAWHVEMGRAQRGDAWTHHEGRRLRIPGGIDESSRVIRAHELAHVKFSPACDPWKGHRCFADVSQESLVVVEEFRVNRLISLMGYDLDELVDGSEELSGSRVEETVDGWNNTLDFYVATYGGLANKKFVKGVKKASPAIYDHLKKFGLAWRKALRDQPSTALWYVGSTEPMACYYVDPDNPDEIVAMALPRAYIKFTVPLARLLDKWKMSYPGPGNKAGDETPDPAEFTKKGEGWGVLHFGDIPLDKTSSGLALARKRHAALSGTRVMYPGRMLTDPQRRVFGGVAKTRGGVLLMDMSGSMSLTTDDIDRLLASAKGLTVLGYTYSGASAPNIWVLARNGKRVSSLADINMHNNVVDLPALRYAQSIRKKGEPLVWVSDGATTKLNEAGVAGTDECAEFVKANGVHMVRDITTAIRDFQRGGSTVAKTTYADGPVTTVARDLGYVKS